MLEVTQKIDDLRSLSQLFTVSQLDRVLKTGDLQRLNSRFRRHLENYHHETYSEIFKSIYSELIKNYRSEYLYKNTLLNKEVLRNYSLKTTTILNEFKIGSSWADFVFINGEIRVYEIKTELDSLSKLNSQLKNYLKFANKVYVVASSKHIKNLKQELEELGVGLIEFTKRNALRKLIESKENSDKLDHETIFKTLRKHEYLEIIKKKFGVTPKVPNTKIFKECLNLAKSINVGQFQRLAFFELKKRKLQCPEYLISTKTPYELRYLCHTMDLSENEYASLYSFLQKKSN